MGKIFVSTGAVMTDTLSVKKYMSEIKKAPLLDKDTETELARKALDRLDKNPSWTLVCARSPTCLNIGILQVRWCEVFRRSKSGGRGQISRTDA